MVDWTGTTEYTYDVSGRLDSATYPGPVPVDYNYDWVGNRVNPPSPPNPMEFNAADQLTRWPGNHQYEYFGTGSLHYRYDDGDPRNLQKTYQYTPDNQLSLVTHAGVPTASSMTWDADGHRISLTSSAGGTYNYVYDTRAGVPAVLEESAGGVAAYYVRDPNGSLIAQIAGDGLRYYHFDALGSTRLLTDAAGSITDQYAYDAWGNALLRTGTTAQPYQYLGRLGYYTHFQDPNLPLLQLGVRLYSPSLGGFTQGDPLAWLLFIRGYAESAYIYASSGPTRRNDASGLYSAVDCQKNCPKLDEYIRQVFRAMESEACWDAIASVGCADYMEKMRDPKRHPLQGIEILCVPLSTCEGAAGNGWFEIDCKRAGPRSPGVIIHELMHTCAFNAGQHPEPCGPWQCDFKGCTLKWPNADPVWEHNAERVKHACFK